MTTMINTEDMPAKQQLEQAAGRLRKCSELLKTYKTKHNPEDPESLAAVANFLEMLSKRDA